MISVGQQLSLMCIGQDVRGNIKLSLKATLPRPGGMETNNVAEESVLNTKDTHNIWAPVGNEYSTQEEWSAGKVEVGETKPSILIRSAAECDEEEKSSNQSSKRNLKSRNGSQLGHRSKPLRSSDPVDSTPIKSSDLAQHVIDSLSSLSVPFPHEKSKKSKPSVLDEAGDKDVTPKVMKLGTEVTAKVDQIRAHGLVLALGGGIRGMYRFEV